MIWVCLKVLCTPICLIGKLIIIHQNLAIVYTVYIYSIGIYVYIYVYTYIYIYMYIHIYIYIFKYIYLQNPQVTFFSPHANGQEFLFNSFRLDILMQNWPFGVCQWNFERGLDQPLVHASPFPPPSFQHWLNFFKRGWSETSNRAEVAMFKSQNASVSFSTMFSS